MDELQEILEEIKAHESTWIDFKNCVSLIYLVDKNYYYLAQFEGLRLLVNRSMRCPISEGESPSLVTAMYLLEDIISITKRARYNEEHKSNLAHIDKIIERIPELDAITGLQEYKDERVKEGTKILNERYGLEP